VDDTFGSIAAQGGPEITSGASAAPSRGGPAPGGASPTPVAGQTLPGYHPAPIAGSAGPTPGPSPLAIASTILLASGLGLFAARRMIA
jgi:hypothetical protein